VCGILGHKVQALHCSLFAMIVCLRPACCTCCCVTYAATPPASVATWMRLCVWLMRCCCQLRRVLPHQQTGPTTTQTRWAHTVKPCFDTVRACFCTVRSCLHTVEPVFHLFQATSPPSFDQDSVKKLGQHCRACPSHCHSPPGSTCHVSTPYTTPNGHGTWID
jgi:hypothetical protein